MVKTLNETKKFITILFTILFLSGTFAQTTILDNVLYSDSTTSQNGLARITKALGNKTDDTQTFLKNCYNALNKKGILFLTTPNVINYSNRVRLLFGNDIFISGDKAHIRFFNPKTITKEVEQTGFKVEMLTGYNGRKISKNIPIPRKLSEGIIVVARKK